MDRANVKSYPIIMCTCMQSLTSPVLWPVSSTVQEFHELYEMQRRRLENQVVRLTEERDLWSKVTYSLTLKVCTQLSALSIMHR